MKRTIYVGSITVALLLLGVAALLRYGERSVSEQLNMSDLQVHLYSDLEKSPEGKYDGDKLTDLEFRRQAKHFNLRHEPPREDRGNMHLDEMTKLWSEVNSLSKILDESTKRYGWTPEVEHANQVQWHFVCQDVISNAPAFEVTTDELNALDPRYVFAAELRAICGHLTDESELSTLDNFIAGRSSVDAVVSAEMQRLRSLITSGANEQAVEVAGELLSRGVKARDEHLIVSVMGNLAFNELLEPFIEVDNANYKVVYMNVYREASQALLCREMHGCIGWNHPFVLRQCVARARASGAFCISPENFDEAVFQTLTPIEYHAFKSLVDQAILLIRKVSI